MKVKLFVCVCVIRNVGKRFCLNVRGNGKVYEMVLFIFTVHSINRQVGLTHSPTTVDVLYWWQAEECVIQVAMFKYSFSTFKQETYSLKMYVDAKDLVV